jgi:hypothetical protein
MPRIHFDDGKFTWGIYTYDPVINWILREKEICLCGSSLSLPAPKAELFQAVLANMNSYWKNRIQTHERLQKFVKLLPKKLVLTEIERSVLGILRQYYILRETGIIAKREAGYYGLRHLLEEWHDVIQVAIAVREGEVLAATKSKQQYVDEMIACMKYIVKQCNRLPN